MKKIVISFIGLIFFSLNIANAELHLVLTKGLRASIPIAIIPFANQQSNLTDPNNIASVVSNDLQNSGHFKVMPMNSLPQQPTQLADVNFNSWQQSGYDYMVIGSVTPAGGSSDKVSFSLINAVAGANTSAAPNNSAVVLTDTFTVPQSELRGVAHKISDIIYKNLTGIPGIFSTRISYVLINRPDNALPTYYLEVADADGYNPRALVQSNAPLMSPSWSPNGQEIAYVSLANQQASIYIVNVVSGQQRLVSDFEGINGAPAWSPDGSQLAIVLSKTGQPKIYLYSLASGSLKQLTTGYSIDTEPDFSPDGQSIIFTSDRGGNPQIYQLNLATNQITRMTFDGSYNAKPQYTFNGQNIVVLHQDSEGYNIAIQNTVSGGLTVLTSNGYDSTPSVAPNGQMIIYANNSTVNGSLGLVSADGQVQLTFPAPSGSNLQVLEPAWSPFLG